MTFSGFAAFVCVLLAAIPIVSAAARDPQCLGEPNLFPFHTASPTLVKEVRNGKEYLAGPPNNTFSIVHVWGTPHEKGYAHGQLRRDEIRTTISRLYVWLNAKYTGQFLWIFPLSVQQFITRNLLFFALQVSFHLTMWYIPQEYLAEMQGMAEGADVSVMHIQAVNQFPELIKAACAIVGATNKSTSTRRLSQLRSLDFEPQTPASDVPQVTVYHPENSSAEPTYALFGFTPMIGVVTGFSSAGIGIGEKVWLHHSASIDGVMGEPWMFVLRDALRARSIDAALTSMRRAHRTCAIFVGVGDNHRNIFRRVDMAQGAFQVYADDAPNSTLHPPLPGVVYVDRHAQPPTSDPCLPHLLRKYYGQLDAETLVRQVGPRHLSGRMHAAGFDYANQVAYFSVARRTYGTDGAIPAYARQHTRLDMAALFAESPPRGPGKEA